MEIPSFCVELWWIDRSRIPLRMKEDCLESFARRAREGHRNRKPGTRNRAADRLDWSRACSYVGVRTGTRNTSADSRCMRLSRSRNPLGVARYCSIRLQPASSCDSEERIQGRNFTFRGNEMKISNPP